MNIVFSILFGATCGLVIGYALAIMLANGSHEDQAAALDAVQQDNILLRRQLAAQADQLDTVTSILNATLERERMLEEITREMNQ